jgi:hypothetical protein
LQVGDPISEGWAIYKRFWRHLLPIAFVTYVVISLVALVLALVAGVLGVIAGAIVSVAGVFLLQSALVEAVADVRDGRADMTLSETVGRVWPRIWTVVGAAVLAGLAIGIGFILLIVPGLYLITIWSVIIPAVVLEKRGVMESFGRSRELVRGYGWTVFGVILVTFVIELVAGIVLSLVLHALPGEISRYLANVISNTLFAPFIAATLTCMYFRLKTLHEPIQVPAGAAFADE